MTFAGWIMMSFSVGGVSALFIWCMYKSLTTPEETEKMHGFEIETPDKKRVHGKD